jgi:hypothetical protein
MILKILRYRQELMNKPASNPSALILLTLCLALALSACSGNPSMAPTTSAQEIYTQVAATLTAAVTQAPSQTASPLPSLTATAASSFTPTPTLISQQPTQPVKAVVPQTSNVSYCDNSAYVSDATVADGTVFSPGETFTKTWFFQNSGSCAWSTSYSIVFVSGSAMSGSTTSLPADVSSGSQGYASVSLTAPSSAGTYTGYWRLQNASGAQFGQSVYVKIVVSEATSTSTPTATATGSTSTPTSTSAAATSTPTSAVATATTEPTKTPIPTSAPTATPASTEVPTATPTATS